MFRVFCLLIGYCIGCIQSAYFFCKIIAKIDIRQHGSGNAGATNVVRVLGKKAGLIIFALDILKAVIAYILCSVIFEGNGSFLNYDVNGLLPGVYASLGVVVGHNWPAYLKFKGGKGISATLGTLLCLDFRVAITVYLFGLIILLLTKYVSLASITMTVLIPIIMFIFKLPTEVVILGFCFTVLAVYKHKQNIERLLNKTENRFEFKKK